MKNLMSLSCALGLFLGLLPGQVIGQITAGPTELVIESLNPKQPAEAAKGHTVKDMKAIQFGSLFQFSSPTSGIRSGGISASNFGPNGIVRVSVYLYDDAAADGKGTKIYGCYSTSNSASGHYEELSDMVSITDRLSGNTTPVYEKDIIRILQATDAYRTGTCTEWKETTVTRIPTGMQSGLRGAKNVCLKLWDKAFLAGALTCVLGGEVFGFIVGDDTPITEKIKQQSDYDCASRYLGVRPVIVELSVKNATLNALKLPCFGDVDLASLYSYVNTFKVTVSINGTAQPTLTYPTTSPANYQVTMGDDIKVKVESSSLLTPEIHGATKVWTAPFAGDLTFQCDPDLQPGGYLPFVGMDTRVHTLMLRPYPSGFNPTAPDWNPKGQLQSQTGLYNYEWSWTADRQSDSTKSTYTPSLVWPKAHLDPAYRQADGSFSLSNDDAFYCSKCKQMTYNHGASGFQRQDQKEGLNIQYLTYFKNWQYSNFQNYGVDNGRTAYMEGFDDDELGYFNTQNVAPSASFAPCSTLACQNTVGITKLEVLPWKNMPEGTVLLLDGITGFPSAAGGFALNWMIDAYRLNHNDPTHYRGYEIQDQNVDWNHADGNGSNNTHPGKVNVMVGNAGQTIPLSFTVKSPLDKENGRDLGFYEALVGEANPSMAEQGVRYWLRGVKNKSDTDIAKYTLVYSWMDRLGVVTEKTANVLTDIVTPWRSTSSTWQSWVNTKEAASTSKWWNWLDWGTGKGFEVERPAYAWMTVYYQRTSTSQRVPVAGKEISPMFLMFCGIDQINTGSGMTSFVEGKGQACKVFMEEYRQSSGGDFTSQRMFGNSIKYANKYSKEYVIQQNATLRFTTFDGDPWLFDNDEEEWYLSNRSMAKRVRNWVLDGSYSIDASTGLKVSNTTPDANKAYLQYYIRKLNDDGTEPLTGGYSLMPGTGVTGVTGAAAQQKNLTCTFTTAGYYALRVAYRGGSDLYIRIKVVNYPSDKAVVNVRPLSAKEAGWLNILTPGDFQVYEVKDVLTTYRYRDGYRAKVSDAAGYAGKPNRWSKYNDYADTYSWKYRLAGVTTFLNLLQELEAITYINGYGTVRSNWFWNDWALHYSSNWLGVTINDGSSVPLQGLPPYVPNTAVTRVYNTYGDLDSYRNYFSTTLFNTTRYASQLLAPWQFVIPLLSYTDYYGVRARTNPSCIYDLKRVFNDSNGAFSGAPPNPANPEDIQAPDYLDTYKDQQDFYHDIKYQRKMVVSNGFLNGATVQVYQNNPVDGTSTTLVASRIGSSSAREAAPAEETLQMFVSPNPSMRGHVMVTLSHPVTETANVTLLDGTGATMLTESRSLHNQDSFKLDTRHLVAGVYVLKVSVGADVFEQKLVIY